MPNGICNSVDNLCQKHDRNLELREHEMIDFTIFTYNLEDKKMKTIDINTTLIDGYLQLLDNLSPSNKLDLISKLTLSVKTDIIKKKKSFYEAFGSWKSNQTADQIIGDIRDSRTFTRHIEQF